MKRQMKKPAYEIRFPGITAFLKKHTIREAADKYNVSYDTIAGICRHYSLQHKAAKK